MSTPKDGQGQGEMPELTEDLLAQAASFHQEHRERLSSGIFKSSVESSGKSGESSEEAAREESAAPSNSNKSTSSSDNAPTASPESVLNGGFLQCDKCGKKYDDQNVSGPATCDAVGKDGEPCPGTPCWMDFDKDGNLQLIRQITEL
ncbi:hypothetical protein K491DRAFT_720324 [Lophiostoma macrostomum CBS 122681]|uniref:Uncharacterized protein n=1 Tax=Lophiostoma macrostomum CBS 122681 TaxID=1314788 RepID=A0A6A6STC5_9PLEO|nr:hypothetical protein K491DRAFT_720324 [Lophiostoma macrostomum CBS 122681]